MMLAKLAPGCWRRMSRVLVVLAGLMLVAPVMADPSFPFHMLRTLTVPGNGPAQAVAFLPGGNVAFVAAGHEVSAYASDNPSPEASQVVAGTVTGLAVAPGGRFLYAVTRAPAKVLVMDPSTLKVIHRRALHGGSPDAVFEDAATHALYVVDGAAREIMRISPSTLEIESRVRLPRTLGQVVPNARGRLYAVAPGHGGVYAIDARTMRRLPSYATPHCTPSGALALDTVGRRLFVGCRSGTVAILDTDMGFVFRRIQAGSAPGTRAVFAFHPASGSGWKGGMFMVAARHLQAVRMNAFVRYAYGGMMALPGVARSIALSPADGQIWVGVAASAAPDAGPARVVVFGSNGGRP
ncbi:hypothetical protein [Oleiagrimonas sp.]|jgi:hypothetical protein|uniref:YncE family protein n=1 Tax=Oleiagrimonas sp. TaxID=2010330 RepID=UPI002616F23A|nr:hypothetical protein [Oleiagrimonas sp.]MDA3912880.1 hypothetical protein [Oleiagrimonas sp.]